MAAVTGTRRALLPINSYGHLRKSKRREKGKKRRVNYSLFTMKNKYVLLGLLSIASIALIALQYSSEVMKTDHRMPKSNQTKRPQGCPEKKNEDLLLSNILKIAESINNAEKHVRGMKTAYYLKKAKAQLKVALGIFGINNTSTPNPAEVKSKNICPEKYMGTKHGFPLYETGFVEQNCTYSTPISKLLTILTLGSQNLVEKMLLSIQKTFPGVKVIAGVTSEESKRFLEKKFKIDNVTIIIHKSSQIPGMVWNRLLQSVNTEYVFISRDTTEVDRYSRFSRLIREMEIQDKPIASGSIRNINSHWKIGCCQRAFRNYTLAYYEGYDESVNECLICDHVDGPFIMKTEVFKTRKFNEKISGEGLFEDFFIRVGFEKVLNCPDAMFHVYQQEKSQDYQKWDGFARIQEVARLRFIPGFDIEFPCKKSTECNKGGKYAVHPCCLKQLSDIIVVAMEICDKAKVVCELDTGSLLSAVKTNDVFPWEVDGDIAYLTSNRSVIINTATKFRKERYSVSTDRGYFRMNVPNWFLEAFELGVLSSEEYIKAGKNQTKILLKANWLGASINPGLMARNRYGKFCYRHQVHWRYLGSNTSWLNYDTTAFPECRSPGNHKCMDLYRTDGNLQFSDPLP